MSREPSLIAKERGKASWAPALLAPAVLIVGICATLIFARQLASTARERDAEQFARYTQRQQDIIAARVETYTALLRGAAGLFASRNELVTPEEFRKYVARIALRQKYPGVLGVGYSRHVAPGTEQQLISEMKAAGLADFHLWPDDIHEQRHAILYLEPLDERNKAAIGFDMYAEPTRRAAMDRARDLGAVAATGKVVLVQETEADKHPGFLLYLPVFSGGAAPATIDERKEKLEGFVYAPFRSKEFFESLVSENREPAIEFEVFDGNGSDPQSLLYQSSEENRDGAAFRTQKTLVVAGRPWTIDIRSTKVFEASLNPGVVPAVMGGGMLLSLLLASIVWLEARSRAIAERDRTNLAIANEAAKRSGEQFQLLANTIQQLAWMAKPNGDIFWYNQRWYDYTGTTFEQMQGWGWQNVHDPKILPRVMERWKRSIDSGESFDMTFPLRGADGEFRPFLTRINPLKDADGRVVLWFGTNTDLSERVKLEERFRLTADAAPVMIWIADASRNCVWSNKARLEFVGKSSDADTGWADGVHPDDIDRCTRAFHSSFDSRRPFKLEYRMLRFDGRYRWIVDHGVPLYEGPGGAFSGFIGSCIDIHDMKQAEAERQELLESERAARSEAERASRLKDEFLATLSHELRTPLNAILGWSQILDKRLDADHLDDIRRGLEVITRNARLQSQLIEDLLDMSRIISGKLRLDIQQMDPGSVILAAIESVRPAAEAKGIRIEQTIDHHVGPIRGDHARLQQVVWNLLTNAIKFTPKNGKVQVALQRVNSHIEIAVTDTGAGIAPDFLPHVFDRFRQADGSTTRRHGGLGLGLAIVQSLVEAHAGKVRVASPGLGHGATFTVELPLMVVHEPFDPDETREHPTKSIRTVAATESLGNENALEGVRVLVVDDEPDARELIKRVLTESAADVQTAADANEAIDRLSEWKPDVLISDIGMPGMDGYGLIRKVRSMNTDHGGDIPAAALTAFARSEDRRRALLAGYQTHIAKPVEPAELITVVASLAGKIGTHTSA